MILITTGTTHFPFPRLINFCIKHFSDKSKEQVIIQNSNFEYQGQLPSHIKIKKIIKQGEILSYYKKARMIISAAGEGTIMQLLELSTHQPILFPRNPLFKEHVDKQQVRIAQEIENKKWCQLALDTDQLKKHLSKQPKKNKLKNKSFQPPLQLIEFLHTITP